MGRFWTAITSNDKVFGGLIGALATLVAASIAFLGIVYQQQGETKRAQEEVEQKKEEVEQKKQELEEEKARNENLFTNDSTKRVQAYYDEIAGLLPSLRKAQRGDEVSRPVEAKTRLMFLGLYPTHKGEVVRYLHDEQLLKKDAPVISLGAADLSKAALRNAVLNETNLSVADLRLADLTNANLSDANLTVADLNGVYLTTAKLSNADLRIAKLNDADLRDADLSSVDLDAADLSNADLRGANLTGATNITNERLEQQAYSLEGATMPDGWLYVASEPQPYSPEGATTMPVSWLYVGSGLF